MNRSERHDSVIRQIRIAVVDGKKSAGDVKW